MCILVFTTTPSTDPAISCHTSYYLFITIYITLCIYNLKRKLMGKLLELEVDAAS